ncbi:uncharacterized protein ACNLHF_001464 [Anomaloglossus baeobatrachus]
MVEKRVFINSMEGEQNIEGILAKVYEYYSELFNTKSIDNCFTESILDDISISLDPVSQESLIQDLSEEEVSDAVGSFKAEAPTSDASQPEGARTPPEKAPTLEPWMRQTVALKLKAVDGRLPDMSSDVFCKKMILDQGFSRAETLSVQTFMTGIFLVTFATVNACRRYWEAMNAAMPDSPFHSFLGSCPIQRDEKRITVSMRNPHTPGRDISTFLGRLCTVVREPSHILNGNGFWTGKWSVTVRLHRDPASEDGLQHLPPTFSLGNSFGLIYYPDMPHNCRKCGGKGHSMKTCKEDACRVCRVTGHSSKDCPKKKTCNLCGDFPALVSSGTGQRKRKVEDSPVAEPSKLFIILEELRAAYSTWRAYKAGFQSVSDWWEYVKLEFRFFFQAKSQQQACLKRRDFRRLQRELRSLQDLLRCGWDVREELEETKRSLKRHFEEESERIVFRSKVENLEKGEKCNSFFFRKLHAGHTPMNELRDESGSIRCGKENVMKVVSDFYSELYARKTTDPEAADKFLSELFAEAIRRNGEIRGITAPGPERFEVKCSLYMDDVTVFCADRRSVDTLVQTCETFGRASGAKVNCGKSEAMLFGDWQPASSAPFPFSIQPDFIKVLGVWFGKEGAALKSWEERLTKITQRIGLWSLRRLTCEGKALVLRNEVLPVLQYTAQAWPPLATVCRAITRTVFRFVWGSKMDRVKRSIMYKDPRKGGKGAKSQQQACLKRRDFRRLQRELRSLQDLLRCGWDVREELEETKRSLKRHFEEESERIVFRSKVENLEKGEKCNSFFFRKLHAGHTPMNELRDESGSMRRGKENVMKVVSDFYSELYARKTTDPEAADKFLSELFAEAIRRNGEIRGITAPGPERFEVKCSLYMDDVTVFCADRAG